MYVGTAFQVDGPQFGLFATALKKYGAPNTPIDGISSAGFATVMNVQKALSTIKGTPTTKTILAAFKTGSDHPNYMSHPYTCNGQAVAKAVSICNDYYLVAKVQGTQLVVSHPNLWVTSKGYFKGL